MVPFVPDMLDVDGATARDVFIVAISHHEASTAIGVKVARVIHHGIDAADVPVGRGLGRYVCFLGRMDPNKGVLEAVRFARRAGLPLRIAAKMHKAAERDYFDTPFGILGPETEYLGELNVAEKYELLGGAVALLNQIRWAEPFGMAMIESFATGTPVVATPQGSAPELVDDGQTGFLRAGVGASAEALQHAGELDRRLCRAAVEGRFSAARMAVDYGKLYSDVLGAKRDRWAN